jgi:hypothetical protein
MPPMVPMPSPSRRGDEIAAVIDRLSWLATQGKSTSITIATAQMRD